MTNAHSETSFMDYWEAVDEAMRRLLGIDTTDAGIEPELIASAQEQGDSPDDFVLGLALIGDEAFECVFQ